MISTSHIMYKGRSVITLCTNKVGIKINALSQSIIGVYLWINWTVTYNDKIWDKRTENCWASPNRSGLYWRTQGWLGCLELGLNVSLSTNGESGSVYMGWTVSRTAIVVTGRGGPPTASPNFVSHQKERPTPGSLGRGVVKGCTWS